MGWRDQERTEISTWGRRPDQCQVFEVAKGQSEKLKGVTKVRNLNGKEASLERKVKKS